MRHELISDPVKLLVKHPSLWRQRKRLFVTKSVWLIKTLKLH